MQKVIKIFIQNNLLLDLIFEINNCTYKNIYIEYWYLEYKKQISYLLIVLIQMLINTSVN